MENWFYDAPTRTILDENRLSVARDVNATDAAVILAALRGPKGRLAEIIADMLAYEAEEFDAEPKLFYVHVGNITWGPFYTREEAQSRVDLNPGATIGEEPGAVAVNGADLVDAFTEWRDQLKAAACEPLGAVPVAGDFEADPDRYDAEAALAKPHGDPLHD